MPSHAPPAPRVPPLTRAFAPLRQAHLPLAAAYELLVPVPRRPLPRRPVCIPAPAGLAASAAGVPDPPPVEAKHAS